jgi:hypothetical protein
VSESDELIEGFASLDRARLPKLDQPTRDAQLAARQSLLEYIEALWQDVERAGERPEVGEKYRSLTTMRELARSMTTVAFDAVYDRPSKRTDPDQAG